MKEFMKKKKGGGQMLVERDIRIKPEDLKHFIIF